MTRNEVFAILCNADEATLANYYNDEEFNRIVEELAEEDSLKHSLY